MRSLKKEPNHFPQPPLSAVDFKRWANESILTVDEIPEIPLTLNPKTPEARSVIGFKWNATAGKEHKIGGQPDWIQGEDTPECPQCFKKMTFYGQLDCLGDKVALGDCGRVYVFVCFDCLETKSVLQFH